MKIRLNLKKQILLQLFIIALGFCNSVVFAQNQENYNLLWKVEGNGLQSPSYLFGTMHVDDIRAFKFSDAVMPAIKSCEVFALEIHMDSTYIAVNNKIIKDNPKDTFKSVLNNQEYQLLVERFKEINGYSFEESKLKDPNIILNLLYPDEDKQTDKSTFVDMYLLSQAKTMQKEITGLEAIETQINHFESLSKKEKRAYILDKIESPIVEMDSMKNVLTELYYEGNIFKIERYMIEELNGFDDEIIERNKIMASNIDKIIKKQSLFSAIGTAHLPGEFGVIKLLQQKGYTLTPVIAEFTGIANNFKIDQSKFKWFTFIDKDLGYSVELPSAPNYTEDTESFKVHTYHSPVDNSSYVMFGLDFRHTPSDTLPTRDLIENYIKRLESTYNGSIVYNKERAIEGGIQNKTILVQEDQTTITSQISIKDKMVYYHTVQTENPSTNLKSVDRFLSSATFFEPQSTPKQPKVASWETKIYKEGAFSINLPGKPKSFSREAPNPLDPEGEPYFLNMYSVVDKANNDNYLFRYNDLPKGYYMDNPEGSFQFMSEHISSNGTAVSEPKIIYLNGYEGREYEVLINDKYHSFIRVYIRGNRTYLLLQQKLNETDKVSLNNPFFKDFKFIDYETAPLEEYTVENTEIKIKKFDNIKVSIDTENFDSTLFKGSYDYYTTDPNTGDVYQYSYGDFQDYFKTSDLTQFYSDNLDLLKNWNDSIIEKRSIKIGTYDGIEAVFTSDNSSVISKRRVWIQNKKWHLFTAYIANEDHNKNMSDNIFNSFIDNATETEFDIYSSKTKLILSDLKSKDSIVQKRAIGAFEYYEFEEKDLPDLHKSFAMNYEDSESSEQIKSAILNEFSTFSNGETLKILETEYEKLNTSEELKSNILSLMHQLDDENSITTYLDLLFNNPPKKIENYNWSLFSPLKDSLSLSVNNLDKLVDLVSIEDLRSSVLEISGDILADSIYGAKVINQKTEKLMTYANEDIANYIKEVEDTTNYDYTYNGRIYNYLRLMDSQILNRTLVEEFTNKLITRTDNDWFKKHAAVARIKNEIPIKKPILNSLMDSLSSRFSIIKAYHDLNKLDKVPLTYLDEENMALLSIHTYLEEIDEYGFEIHLIDVIENEGNRYYATSINYDFDNDEIESYFALIGPIYKVSQDKDFTLYDTKTNWDTLDENWKAQSELLLNKSDEEE